jgi:stress response protein YsnF
MQNFREYNEILSIMKKLIDKGEIKIQKIHFLSKT